MIRLKKSPLMTITIILVGIFVLLMGCSKVTPENLKKINSGMTYAEVQKIIGDPANCESKIGLKSCVWEEGDKRIKVQFLAEKVLLFSSKNL